MFIFLKMILLTLFVVFCYHRFNLIEWSTEKLYLEAPLFVLISVLLTGVNWWLEYLKWTTTLGAAIIRGSRSIVTQSFFAGIITGMLTPNMQGNFLGRLYYYERQQRIPIIILTLVGNFAQFIVSIVLGIVAIILLNKTPFDVDLKYLIPVLGVVCVLLVLLYFNFEWVLRWVDRKGRVQSMIRNLKDHRTYRLKLLFLSLLRHAVFTLQFLFMLHAFGEDLTFVNVIWIWQVYLWVTLAPSLFLGKLAIRESIALWILGFAGMGNVSILISSFLIWFFNLLLPTVIGLIVCKRKM